MTNILIDLLPLTLPVGAVVAIGALLYWVFGGTATDIYDPEVDG